MVVLSRWREVVLHHADLGLTSVDPPELLVAASLGAGAAGPGRPAQGENLAEAWGIALRVNAGLQSQQNLTVAEGFNLETGIVTGQNATEAMAAAFGASRVVLTGGRGERPGPKVLECILAAFRSDMDKLYQLDLGRYAELGQPVDATEAGPLGALWPSGGSPWFNE